MNRLFIKWVIIAITCFLLFLDRLLKVYSANFLTDNSLTITNFFHLHYSLNPYLAFSIPLPPTLSFILITLSLLIIIVFIYQLRRQQKNWPALLLTLVSISALTNFYDRIFYGGVIDYLEIINLSSFNLADLIISACIGVLIIILMRQDEN